MKKLCVVGKNKNIDFDIEDVDIHFLSSINDISQNYDLIALWNYRESIEEEFLKNNNIINLHPSLLPSFKSDTPIKDAYMYGVKVTGVTVHRVENPDLSGRILAQYPVMIDSYTHYDELENEINKLGAQLYPLVIKSILEDKVFDIVDFLSAQQTTCKGSCTHGCSNCSKILY
ncbi:MAG: hypothetical protein K6E29_07310 [Cyanobacteria bacterium RUI128]|nr:hypothetical protein [Cyanobacteria bacterium RUI128]